MYVFRRESGLWVEKRELLSGDPSPGGVFGRSVSSDGVRIVVGAPGEEGLNGTADGKAHVFRLEESAWVADRILVDTSRERYGPLGVACAVDGATAVAISAVALVFDVGAALIGVDFDVLDDGSAVPPGTEIDDEYLGRGVLFSATSAEGNSLPPFSNIPQPPTTDDIVPVTPPNFLQTRSGPGNTDSDAGTIIIEFVDPVTGSPRPADFVSVFFLDIEGSGDFSDFGPGRGVSRLLARDEADDVIDSVLIPRGPNGGVCRALIGGPGSSIRIARAICYVGDELDSGAIDGVVFTVAEEGRPEIACRTGGVGSGSGSPPVDVLQVNPTPGRRRSNPSR